MGISVASREANALAAQALYEHGATAREVAKKLGMSVATAWRLKHAALTEPDLIHHVSKTIADKTLLCANAAVDTFLDHAENGELSKQTPIQLAKAASVLLQASGAYAALSGAKDTFSAIVAEYGITPSHAASRVTVESKITVESAPTAKSDQQTIDITGCRAPTLGARQDQTDE